MKVPGAVLLLLLLFVLFQSLGSFRLHSILVAASFPFHHGLTLDIIYKGYCHFEAQFFFSNPFKETKFSAVGSREKTISNTNTL